MKLKSFFSAGFLALLLTACGSQHNFSQSDLPAELYQGYWAMHPIDDVHRVVRFNPTSAVTIYDYTCNGRSDDYRLNETETVYLSVLAKNSFSLLDNKKQPFARFDIVKANAQYLQAKQRFNEGGPTLNLHYRHLIGSKPIC